MESSIIQSIKFDDGGLIPAIIQDSSTNDVIALYYMDNDSLVRTLKTGETCFSVLPASGPADSPEASYKLVDVRINSDGHSLTVLVSMQEPPAKQKSVSLLNDALEVRRAASSEVSLVDVDSMEFGLAITELYTLIADRKEKRPEGSYTTYLFNSGLDKILKKIAEEAGEVIIASKNRSSREVISELADLFYHLLVLMVERDVKLSDVHSELLRRANRSPVADTRDTTRADGSHTD